MIEESLYKYYNALKFEEITYAGINGHCHCIMERTSRDAR